MKAFICDRCGKTFTGLNFNLLEKYYQNAYHALDHDNVDMCFDCCVKFQLWMDYPSHSDQYSGSDQHSK